MNNFVCRTGQPLCVSSFVLQMAMARLCFTMGDRMEADVFIETASAFRGEG